MTYTATVIMMEIHDPRPVTPEDEITIARRGLREYLRQSLAAMGYEGPTEFNAFFLMLPPTENDALIDIARPDAPVEEKQMMLMKALEILLPVKGSTTEHAIYDFLKNRWPHPYRAAGPDDYPPNGTMFDIDADAAPLLPPDVEPFDPADHTNDPAIDWKERQLPPSDRRDAE